MKEKHPKVKRFLSFVYYDLAKDVMKPNSAIYEALKSFAVVNCVLEDQRLPCSLCDSLSKKLAKIHQGDVSPVLPVLPSYKVMQNFRHPEASKCTVTFAVSKVSVQYFGTERV